MQTLTITAPDDWHCHLRDDSFLETTVPASARCFVRSIVMPNLKTPITTVQAAKEYRLRILKSVPSSSSFTPLMTLYLTDTFEVDTINQANQVDFIKACKLYPAGATTHSSYGVRQIENIYPVLSRMEYYQMPLLIHGETTDPTVDIFDKEKFFIEKTLIPLQQKFPNLPIVLEHITTQEAVDYILSAPSHIGATITAHHLLYHRNALFQGGIRPDLYCLPILKKRRHQQALIQAATSGNKKFFLGTDSAPHPQSQKYACHGCAGLFTAPVAIELYAQVFEEHKSLDKLEGFASFYGADFYKLPRNQQTLVLEKSAWQVPPFYPYGEEKVTPACADQKLTWKVKCLF